MAFPAISAAKPWQSTHMCSVCAIWDLRRRCRYLRPSRPSADTHMQRGRNVMISSIHHAKDRIRCLPHVCVFNAVIIILSYCDCVDPPVAVRQRCHLCVWRMWRSLIPHRYFRDIHAIKFVKDMKTINSIGNRQSTKHKPCGRIRTIYAAYVLLN